MDLLEEYQRFLVEKKQSSENTVSSYMRDLGQYSKWLTGEGLTAERATQADVDRYTKHLLSVGKSIPRDS